MIGCTRQNVYRLIRTGKLEASNLLQNKTVIRKTDVDLMFEELKVENISVLKFKIDDCYALKDVVTKYMISEKGLYEYIKRNNTSL